MTYRLESQRWHSDLHVDKRIVVLLVSLKLCIQEIAKKGRNVLEQLPGRSARCLDQPRPVLKVPCNNVSVSKILKKETRTWQRDKPETP